MNEEELIKFLKENLKIDINYEGYNESYSNIYKVTVTIKDEKICSTNFSAENFSPYV